MTSGVGGIGFLVTAGEESRPDYVRRLGRLRWRRRFPLRRATDLDLRRPARESFAPSDDWIVVRDEIAIPVPGGEVEVPGGGVVAARVRHPAGPPVVHTLAEFERAEFPDGAGPADPRTPPALAFRVSDFPPGASETVGQYVTRVLSSAGGRGAGPGFAAVVFDDSTGERPEVVRHFPAEIARLLDVGCGTGEASAALCRDRPGLSVTGIERRPGTAARARERVNRVLEGDAAVALRALAAERERFDAFLFADVLEHLEDPIGALTLARGLALPGATLVASLPNVGHLSLVRDLVRGRFDPLPAGLADAGHLRWFTRASIEDALEEAGWRTVDVTSVPGAPAPDAEVFLEEALVFPGADAASLTTYQWVAVARAE